MDGRTQVRVLGIDEVSLVNIGPGGARIEHAQVIRPGASVYLDLLLAGRETRVRCRVIWSMVHRREQQPDGEEALIYHTELEFLSPSRETWPLAQ